VGRFASPFAFEPFCGLADSAQITAEGVDLPTNAPGIGFELNRAVQQCFGTAFADL